MVGRFVKQGERSEFHKNGTVLNAQLVRGDSGTLSSPQLTCRGVKFPSVPWADELFALEMAHPERAPLVWANVIQCAKLAVDICDANQPVRSCELTGFSLFWEFVDLANFHES
jgi:hypothetical protein